MAFQLGDVVQLKSGGPPLTINALCDLYTPPVATCAWAGKNGEPMADDFALAALRPYDANDDPTAPGYDAGADPAAPASAVNVTRIRPTVGRTVLYFDPVTDGVKPLPAVVCSVNDTGPDTVPTVNVAVHDDDEERTLFRHQVPIYDAGQGDPGKVRCEWMPYQMTAAK